MTRLLVRKLQNYIALSEEEKQALLAIPTRQRKVGPRKDFPTVQIPPGAVHLIDEGFACRYKYLPDGRRQILSYLVPGDIGDLRLFILGRADAVISSLSSITLSIVDREHLLAVTERYPRVTRALWWATLVEESITQEWLVNVGQRSALERLAHLLCELYVRLSAIGHTRDHCFEMPITQTELADTLGLSSVHINRTLQELRRRELISFKDRMMHLKDFEALSKISMFSPSYLHMRSLPGPVDQQVDESDTRAVP